MCDIRAHGAVFAALTRPFTQFSRLNAVGATNVVHLRLIHSAQAASLRLTLIHKPHTTAPSIEFSHHFSHMREKKILQLKTSNDTNRIVDFGFLRLLFRFFFHVFILACEFLSFAFDFFFCYTLLDHCLVLLFCLNLYILVCLFVCFVQHINFITNLFFVPNIDLDFVKPLSNFKRVTCQIIVFECEQIFEKATIFSNDSYT